MGKTEVRSNEMRRMVESGVASIGDVLYMQGAECFKDDDCSKCKMGHMCKVDMNIIIDPSGLKMEYQVSWNQPWMMDHTNRGFVARGAYPKVPELPIRNTDTKYRYCKVTLYSTCQRALVWR